MNGHPDCRYHPNERVLFVNCDRDSIRVANVRLVFPRAYCDQGVGLRTQRCSFSCSYNSSGSGPASLAAMFDSTFDSLRIPGMIVLTIGLVRMKRSASSGMVIADECTSFQRRRVS